jgi:hypothetical protein
MAVYIPPSVRTVREDAQGAVVLTGGEVIPALIGTSNGASTTVAPYTAYMGATSLYTFPALGTAGPVVNISQIRSKLNGGIIYKEDEDYTVDYTAQTVNFGAATKLEAPYVLTAVEVAGTSSLVSGTTYYYVVTAYKTANHTGPVVGETVASNEISIEITAASKKAKITWTPVTGAAGYRIYRTVNTGSYTGSAFLVAVAGEYIDNYTDDGTVALTSGTPPGLSTYGTVVASSGATYPLVTGYTLTCEVDGGATQTVTFTASGAGKIATLAPSTPDAGSTLGLRIDEGEAQTITFAGTESSLTLIYNKINATLTGGTALDDGTGRLRVSSSTSGTDSTVEVTGGSALSALHMTSGIATGTGNVANIAAVTALEVATILEDVVGAISGVNGSGKPYLSSATEGSAGSIKVTGGTANGVIAFSTSLYSGTDATLASALRRPAVRTGSGVGDTFYLDYSYTDYGYFTAVRYTNLDTLVADHGLGSDMAIGGTMAMATGGRGNGASIVVGIPVPDDTLPSYQAALGFLAKRKDITLVVPLTVVAGINTAVKAHCEDLSQTGKNRERIGVVGSPIGTMVGDEDTAGTAIYNCKQMGSRRVIYVHPWAWASTQGSDGSFTDTEYDGWLAAAAVAGRIASLPDRAEPPTCKQVYGLSKLGVELDDTEENLIAAAGGCVLTTETGNIVIRDGITTSDIANGTEDSKISINLTDDLLRYSLRAQFNIFRGRKMLPNTLKQIKQKTINLLSSFVKLQLITGYDSSTITAVQDSTRPTWVRVKFSYSPVYEIDVIEFNYIFNLTAAPLSS